MTTKKHNPRNERPISLHPLTLEEALSKAVNIRFPPDRYEQLVRLLSGIRTKTGDDHGRANQVAGDLVHWVLRETWDHLSDSARRQPWSQSTHRLLRRYRQNLRRLDTSPKEASEQAIDDELEYLEETLKRQGS